MVVGMNFWFIVPNSPEFANFLSTEENNLYIERIRGKT